VWLTLCVFISAFASEEEGDEREIFRLTAGLECGSGQGGEKLYHSHVSLRSKK
jgi:hypothetical protein